MSTNASVTTIANISNKKTGLIYIRDGEGAVKDFSVPRGGDWSGYLPVPWIGSDDENYKVINITIVAQEKDYVIYIYQDYWHPADKNEVKYSTSKFFSYSDPNNKRISGYPDYAGKKKLIIKQRSDDISLEMEVIK